MSLRRNMLQVARRAAPLLDESLGLVHDFLWSQLNDDGGFMDRSGASDLYYTVFGVEALLALQAAPPLKTLEAYLLPFGAGETLDLVHLTCLARCWSLVGLDRLPAPLRSAMLTRLERHRAADGGYHPAPNARRGTLYGCFLAFGAYDDLATPLPRLPALVGCVESLRTRDGAWANDAIVPLGTTPSTAGAATLLRHLGEPVDPAAGQWLLDRIHPQGGFLATPQAPMPDLLSTAVALHALAPPSFPSIPELPEPLREKTLDFLDSLWTNKGSFHGTWADDQLDCEYTFYALLALGHLAD